MPETFWIESNKTFRRSLYWKAEHRPDHLTKHDLNLLLILREINISFKYILRREIHLYMQYRIHSASFLSEISNLNIIEAFHHTYKRWKSWLFFSFIDYFFWRFISVFWYDHLFFQLLRYFSTRSFRYFKYFSSTFWLLIPLEKNFIVIWVLLQNNWKEHNLLISKWYKLRFDSSFFKHLKLLIESPDTVYPYSNLASLSISDNFFSF
ncbi:MAG: hypothetical protein Ta2E_12150 [Mycoplasmoidaceae bacterium]|nr:MAG: hypothetical protein Ta2E_12150 [Mycoplasmoidaceae bacterium]